MTGSDVAAGAMSRIRPNVIWAMDSQFDSTADGRTFKALNIIDEFTREVLAIDLGHGIYADGVVEVWDHQALQHGAPVYVRFDNGPEFVAHAVHDWCRFNGTGSLVVDPRLAQAERWFRAVRQRCAATGRASRPAAAPGRAQGR